MSVIGYAYDADLHCVHCTEDRFGEEAVERDSRGVEPLYDSEGNRIHPIFVWDDVEAGTACGDCSEPI